MPLDYVTLRIIWWVLLGTLLIGFAIMDGFDLGIGMILHRVARTNDERRIVLNAIGPIWEGNQIWLILGAGAIFAAWPDIYAVAFSGFYFAMLLVLLALILRPVGFKYRSKVSSPMWRSTWDAGIFIAGFVPTLVFGIAIGNVLQGVPFYFDPYLQSYYTGSLFALFNPFALLCGLVSISMLLMHGSHFLCVKTHGNIQKRAKHIAYYSAISTIILFILGGLWLSQIKGYVITSQIALDGPSNPLHKAVIQQAGVWLSNYRTYPWMLAAPFTGILGALFSLLLAKRHYFKLAWLMSAFSIAGIIATCGVSMYPFILPSSSQPGMSLLIWDASSSQLTLFIMLIATVIFLPLIIAYTSWVYYVLRGKMTGEYIQQNKSSLY